MSTKTLSVGSLFSGIGGLDLGLERAGMHVIWQSEIDPYASRVLAKHWPNTPNLGNVKEINWHDTPRPDVICGGYPCQPFSVAGKRRAEADERHLFPWVADAIRILRPRYAILENVAGHLTAGFGTVLGTLAEIGYDNQWDCIPAASIGAPHRRDRLFIVAMDANRKSKLFGPIFRQPKRKEWLPEPHMDRVADGISSRMDRLRGLGNAVVPQVAEHIGRIVMAHATQESES
jgi:DNA (cytosine-5)-methyltransferase 1